MHGADAWVGRGGSIRAGLLVLLAAGALVAGRSVRTTPAADPGGCGVPPWPSSPVDVDRAEAAELALLPGVGPALAARIVADRRERGPFGSVAALDRVKGVGAKSVARWTPWAVAGGSAAAPQEP